MKIELVSHAKMGLPRGRHRGITRTRGRKQQYAVWIDGCIRCYFYDPAEAVEYYSKAFKRHNELMGGVSVTSETVPPSQIPKLI